MGHSAGIFIVGVIIVILIAIMRANVTSPGRALQKKFIVLGNMAVLNKTQIINSVGPPTTTTNIQSGQILQWQATGYSMALIFDNDGKFIRIHKEYVHRS